MQPNRKPLSLPRSCLVMVTACFLFVGGVIFLADIKCNYDIENWWAPPYPNAETVSIEYDLFRPRALGVTDWLLESPDDVETVKQFYRDYRLMVMEEERLRGLGWTESFVTPKEDGDGSFILLKSACGT